MKRKNYKVLVIFTIILVILGVHWLMSSRFGLIQGTLTAIVFTSAILYFVLKENDKRY